MAPSRVVVLLGKVVICKKGEDIMRFLLMISFCLLIASIAVAEKPVFDTPPLLRIPCSLTNVILDWNFANGPQDFSTSACDDQGVPVWEHGATTYIAGAPGDVWATVLDGDYPTDSGQALITPAFAVSEETYLLEIFHYYDAEYLWEGGNVKVNGNVIGPLAGYPGLISVPGDWYAWCVDFEMGFTGLDSGWMTSCFDLTSYIGQTVEVSFEFGSDDTFVEAGWYLASVKVGNDGPVATENRIWSSVKSMYR
jgi:hypothetical protein